jgi:hypothetical protein
VVVAAVVHLLQLEVLVGEVNRVVLAQPIPAVVGVLKLVVEPLVVLEVLESSSFVIQTHSH